MEVVTLKELYNRIPRVECKNCGECCGPVQMGKAERLIIRVYCEEHHIPLKHFFAKFEMQMLMASAGLWECPMRREGKCLIYEVRPTICRLQGTAKRLPCPNFLNRKSVLSDKEAGRILEQSCKVER